METKRIALEFIGVNFASDGDDVILIEMAATNSNIVKLIKNRVSFETNNLGEYQFKSFSKYVLSIDFDAKVIVLSLDF